MVGDREVHQAGATSYKEEHHCYHEYNDVFGEAHTVILVGQRFIVVSGHLVPPAYANLFHARYHNLTVILQCSISHHLLLTWLRARGALQ
jgi:hypothetical protein